MLTVKNTSFLLKKIRVMSTLNNRTDFVSFLLNYKPVYKPKIHFFAHPPSEMICFMISSIWNWKEWT